MTQRLDPGAGWYGEFLRRDPEGMRACLDGAAMPPWDVLESLLGDLASSVGAAPLARETEYAAGLRAAAVGVWDRLPGGAEELRTLLASVAAQRTQATSALRVLSARLVEAADPAEAAALSRELSWTRDDASRGASRHADLTARLEAVAPPAPGAHPGAAAHGGPGPLTGVPAQRSAGPTAGTRAGAPMEAPAGTSAGTSAGVRAGAETGAPAGAPVGAPVAEERPVGRAEGRWLRGARRTGGARYAGAAVPEGQAFTLPPGHPSSDVPLRGARFGRPARRLADPVPAGGPLTERDAPTGRAVHPGPAWGARGGTDGREGGPGGHPAPIWSAPDGPGAATAPAPGPHPRNASGAWADAPQDAGEGGTPGVWADGPANTDPRGASHAWPDSAPGGEPQGRWSGSGGSAGPMAASAPGGDPQGGSSRWPDSAPGGTPQDQWPDSAPGADPQGRWSGSGGGGGPAGGFGQWPGSGPGGAPYAGGGDPVEGFVEGLVALRGQGRSGEAHALLCEAAAWPAERLPWLGEELVRAGLAADWATLLWEAASLPPARFAAAAAALGPADREALLRQGAARPAAEIAEAALVLGTAGHTREADALLAAFVRVRTAEESARLARRDPRWFAPRLLRAAEALSGTHHRDLLHALRVANLPVA
ncbi:hypothetical protein [Streptomyces sp. NBC_00096]|uniref:hypothetical protein n=1 Tax=Streptomyces sp. NBC_00096 TaxID=2975650 RepID=UPI003244FF3A